jgi:glycosyltransferase involved in cell wall biosynthesis
LARILFLTELLPYPLVAGAKIRAYYVLRHLAARHRVTLLSFVRADDRPEDVAHLETFLDAVRTVPMQRSWARNARAVVASLASGRPAIIHREEIGAMRHRVEALLATGEFDAVHADQITMAWYGLLAPGAPVKRLLDQHNATFQIIERLAQDEGNRLKRAPLMREARAFARYEADVCQRYDQVTFVTEEDRQTLAARMPARSLDGRSRVIPICVDTGAVEAVIPVRAPFRVTHIGSMYWPPNVEGLAWFREEAWPRVQAEVPEARLTLIGKNPSEQVRAWGQQAGVEVPGYVEDLAAYLAETAVFCVPLHAGAGMRVKVVDAWCWGLPVVSTTIGAEGIAVRDGENILIADSPERFAAAVVQVLQDGGLQARLRSNGRRWVEERYDWRHVYGAWDEVYEQLLRR